MPLGLSAATLIGAGISAASGGAQAFAQGKMNKKTRAWNEKMYALQRQNALADWHTQNEYNSPEAQMARFKAAGLNPHLIYGQGNTAQQIEQTKAMNWSPETPNIAGIGNTVSNSIVDYINAQQAEVGMDLQRQQMENAKTQNELLAANTLKALLDVDRKSIDNALQAETYDYALESIKAKYRGLTLDNEGKELKNQTMETVLGYMDDREKREWEKLRLQIQEQSNRNQRLNLDIIRTNLAVAKNAREEKLLPVYINRLETDIEFRKEVIYDIRKSGNRLYSQKLQNMGVSEENANIITHSVGWLLGLAKEGLGKRLGMLPSIKSKRPEVVNRPGKGVIPNSTMRQRSDGSYYWDQGY